MNSTDEIIVDAADMVEFHWCRHYLGETVLASSTTISLLLSTVMLNAMFGATLRFTRSQLRRIFYPTERKIAFLQYALFMPLFEVFVIWGSKLGISIDTSTASVIVTWIVINAVCLVLVLSSCRAVGNYRLLIHVAQCYRLPMAIMFFCDRLINSEIGIEGIFIGAMFLCSLFEFFHVQDYFSVFSNSNLGCVREAPLTSFSVEDSQDSVYKPRRVFAGPPDDAKQHGSDDQPSIDDAVRERQHGMTIHEQRTQETAYYSSSDEEDKEENASITEFDENITPAVRATLREQKTNALTAEFLQKVMQFNERSDPNVIKRTVLKFKHKLINNTSTKKSNSASGTHESDNF
jgi:hypothetical protein